MYREFQDEVLESKKRRFKEVVGRICKNKNIPRATVNFDGCPNEGSDLAHYHPELNKVCCSRRQLMKLSFDDVYDVANHELAHYFASGHGPSFLDAEERNRRSSFKAPPGVIVSGGDSDDDNPTSIILKGKPGNECQNSTCRQHDELMTCEYCGRRYCSDHITATEPIIADTERHYARSEKSNHACAEFFEVQKQKRERATQEYHDSLDKLLRNNTRSKTPWMQRTEYHYDFNYYAKRIVLAAILLCIAYLVWQLFK